MYEVKVYNDSNNFWEIDGTYSTKEMADKIAAARKESGYKVKVVQKSVAKPRMV